MSKITKNIIFISNKTATLKKYPIQNFTLKSNLHNIQTIKSNILNQRQYTNQNARRTGDIAFEKDLKLIDSENLPIVQWYPGHIAKSERKLQQELKVLDAILEVRDARILKATKHPIVDEWIKNRKIAHLLLLNRLDMITRDDKQLWDEYYEKQGIKVYWTIGNSNNEEKSGIKAVKRSLMGVSQKMNSINIKRQRKPRPLRLCVIGYPNVGKSAIINRLVGRRACPSAPKPGVTRQLTWILIGEGMRGLNVLDSPGIIPTSILNQEAARKVAMCNNIGDASYVDSLIAAQFILTLRNLPTASNILKNIHKRYSLDPLKGTHEDFVQAFADKIFHGDTERAGVRILTDFRKLNFGPIALEVPEISELY